MGGEEGRHTCVGIAWHLCWHSPEVTLWLTGLKAATNSLLAWLSAADGTKKKNKNYFNLSAKGLDGVTLRAPLSGIFLQRKDVVNQCLEFGKGFAFLRSRLRALCSQAKHRVPRSHSRATIWPSRAVCSCCCLFVCFSWMWKEITTQIPSSHASQTLKAKEWLICITCTTHIAMNLSDAISP